MLGILARAKHQVDRRAAQDGRLLLAWQLSGRAMKE
jgi:hypothetical protein